MNIQTKALIEIIFVTVLLDKGTITSQMFTAMLFMAIMSTMATIPVVRPLIKKYQKIKLQRIFVGNQRNLNSTICLVMAKAI